jgi:MFS family permease
MAPCSITCIFSAVFVISMIFMTNAMSTSQTIQIYQKQLPQDLQQLYQQIREERTQIFYTGYIIGFILALIIIVYNTQIKKTKMSWPSMVCLTVTVAFITNYFYYVLTPKTKWMLNHIENPDQTKAWLQMYKNMQTYYHSSLALGIIAIGLFAFAFRC